MDFLSSSTSPPPQEVRLISARQLCDAIGVSRPTLQRYIDAGRLPAPIKLGKVDRWRLRDVEAALDAAGDSVQPPRLSATP